MQSPTLVDPQLTRGLGEPAWELAWLFPFQGSWTEEDYFSLNGNQRIEFSHGYVEVLPMPTTSHQSIALFLYKMLDAFVAGGRLGRALAAPLRVRLWPGKFREPDVLFMLAEHLARIHEQFWEGADLVMEVVSDDDRRRDVVTKRLEYAKAGIAEYWIVDPQQATVTVLKLAEGSYLVHGEFKSGQQASSALLPGFSVDVREVFAQALPSAL